MTNLERPLARPSVSPPNRFGLVRKVALVAAVLLVLGFVVSRLNLARDLSRLDATVVSGGHEGNYFALAEDLTRIAAQSRGRVTNVETAGSADNIARLGAASASGKCDVQFGLAQDGSDWKPGGPKLQVVARLRKAESVFFLGKDADKLTELGALAKMRIGVGPEGSGSARVARQLLELPDLGALGITLSNHSNAEQLERLERGELDLGVFVMDEDAPFIGRAIRERGLQIAGFSHMDVVARRLPHFRTGRIGAGQYDAVKVLPAQDKKVLRVETLVLTNGCAGRSTIIDVLAMLSKRFPELVRHNKETVDTTGLELASAAKAYFEHDGPELADEYVPWLVDVMPPANWAYIVMGISVVFNAMSAGHRFRLWRIDDARVKLESELSDVFGPGATHGDIKRRTPEGTLRGPAAVSRLDALVASFEALADRSRRQSLSMLVPMGQEMAYRYQEGVIHETLAVLRDFRRRAASETTV